MRSGLVLAACVAAAIGAAIPAHAKSEFGNDSNPLDSDVVKEGEPILLQADNVTYDSKARLVTATGHVEITTEQSRLLADRLTYEEETGTVTATGNVSLVDSRGAVAFADSVRLTGDLREGAIENLDLVIKESARLSAARAERKGGMVTTLDRAVFTTCDLCSVAGAHTPLWQVKALRVTRDQNRQRLIYEDATFELFGVPVASLPYFEQPDPETPRSSGVLSPLAGTSDNLGYFIEIPYYFALAPDYDLTLTPLIGTEELPLLKVEWRQLTQNGNYWLDGSLTFADERDEDGRRIGRQSLASHLFGKGRFEEGEFTRWGFDVQLASSDTYLKRFEISNRDRLTSRVFATYDDNTLWADASAYYFQGLRATDREGLSPIVLPFLRASYQPEEDILGGRLQIDASFLAIHRTDGLNTRRLSASASWQRAMVTERGELITLFAQLRGDIYHTDRPDPLINPGISDDTATGRMLGLVGIDYRYPFVRPAFDGALVVEPIVQLILAPYGGNPGGIPNEDSQSFEFDDTNLFSINKFPGLDLWESGPRANIGVRVAYMLPDDGLIEFYGGQTLRTEAARVFSASTGLEETQSDFVGRITFKPNDEISIIQRFRIEKDDLTVRRQELYLRTDYDWLQFDASYVRLAQEAATPIAAPREEIAAGGRLWVSDYWSITGGLRRDIEQGEMVESRFGIAYEDECAALEIGVRRDFTRDRDIEPSTSIMFQVKLKTFGDSSDRSAFDRMEFGGEDDFEPGG